MDNNIPFAALKKLSEHTQMRVSKDAISLLQEACKQHCVKFCRKAYTYTQHAGRKTIKSQDCLLAYQ
ncbi:MAG: histone-like protein [Candidatus Woesearchaeota archaeon]